jgi:hypothetical protein
MFVKIEWTMKESNVPRRMPTSMPGSSADEEAEGTLSSLGEGPGLTTFVRFGGGRLGRSEDWMPSIESSRQERVNSWGSSFSYRRLRGRGDEELTVFVMGWNAVGWSGIGWPWLGFMTDGRMGRL